MPTISVTLPTASYDVIIEPGALAGLGRLVRDVAPHDRALLAVDRAIAGTHGAAASDSLRAAGFEVAEIEIEASEQQKTLETVRRLYAAMLEARLERRSPVIAVGGGVIGDVAGFAAATFLRGVPLVHVPTTLLAMVDASIGGKTGVNIDLPASAAGDAHGDALGKNLVGAFWQPRAVLSDPDTLRTLDARDFRCGLAECVKHGVIADAGLLAFLADAAERILALDAEALTDLIARSARIKIDVVQEDERESGRRALLNLGHTFAHAIEPIPELDLRHGEAVSIGMCAAMECAVRSGLFTKPQKESVEALLRSFGLPTRLARAVQVERLLRAMAYDKKVAGGAIRLVLPTAPGAAGIFDDVTPDLMRAAWTSVGAAMGSDRR